ncbi:cytochrome c oxidase subunit 5B, mitochondrial-like [Athalia rosae]|uniref:cytochrome c oxidase subunit 5B, mitochondrial-like n=1 Tax=Athalia rosae TaxID=37344 RepID=UPI000624F860|nr:cytochrome c oxidase subunit 5B, mitochondrial-like [Athalia rosae]
MASLCGRILLQASRRPIYTSARCGSKSLADSLDHATGLEKRELLAAIAGDDDPFDLKVFKRGPGTKDCPNQVPSAFESRLVGCICEEEATTINWMWLKRGSPRRCECGYWFKLIEKTPI